jgi:cobalt-zinc-cadmium resistance protein CzcA
VIVDGYKVDDIENIVLTQSNGVPVLVKDIAKVSVGYVPRLGIAGRDHDDDVAAAIVVMGRNSIQTRSSPLYKANDGMGAGAGLERGSINSRGEDESRPSENL